MLPVVHGAMSCDQESFIILVVWQWHQLLSRSLPNGCLSWVSRRLGRELFTLPLYAYFLLIDKELCKSQNIAIKFPFALLVCLYCSSGNFFSMLFLYLSKFKDYCRDWFLTYYITFLCIRGVLSKTIFIVNPMTNCWKFWFLVGGDLLPFNVFKMNFLVKWFVGRTLKSTLRTFFYL